MITNLQKNSSDNLNSSINNSKSQRKVNEYALPNIKPSNANSNNNIHYDNYDQNKHASNKNNKKEKKYNHSLEREYEYKKQKIIGELNLNYQNHNKQLKILPYVNNEHIPNIHKINQNIYYNGSPHNMVNRINYGRNNYKPKKLYNDNSINGKLPIIPNRKLSPIRKQMMN